jgi:hypothetical protein
LEDAVHQVALNQERRALDGRYVEPVAGVVWLTVVTPAGRLLRRVVNRIGFGRLAEIDSNDIRYFSTDPTPDEAGLTGCERDLRQFVEDEVDLTRSPKTQRYQTDLSILGKNHIGIEGAAPVSSNLKIVLVESRTEEEIGLHLEVNMLDGKMIDRAYVSTNPDYFIQSARQSAEHNEKSHECEWAPLRAQTQSIVDMNFLHWHDYHISPQDAMLEPWLDTETRQVKIGRLPTRFTAPQEEEPLDFALSEALSALSNREPNHRLVARVPDLLWPYAMDCVHNGRIDVTMFSRFLFGRAGCEWIAGGGRYIIRPQDPLLADNWYASRKILGSWIRKFANDRKISLQSRARLLYQLGSSATSPVAEFYLKSVLGGLPSFINSVQSLNPLVYRLFGSLSDNDWDKIDATGSVELADTGVEGQLVSKIIRSKAIPLNSPPGHLADIYINNPLELYPAGLDDSTDGTVRASSQPSAVEVTRNGQLVPTSCESEVGIFAHGVAFFRDVARRSGTRVDDSEIFQKMLKGDHRSWRPARTRTIKLRLRLPHSLSMEADLNEVTDLQNEVVPTNQLPDDYLHRLFDLTIHAIPQSDNQPAGPSIRRRPSPL